MDTPAARHQTPSGAQSEGVPPDIPHADSELSPILDESEQEPLFHLRARALSTVVFGIGQLVLAGLVPVAAFEFSHVRSNDGARARLVFVVLLAFASYALYRGVRQLYTGVRLFEELRKRERIDRTRRQDRRSS
jgi:hypothetical protein